MKKGDHLICMANNHHILRYGCIYTATTDVQANGLIRVMAYEWGSEYGVNPKAFGNCRVLDTDKVRDTILKQSKEWSERIS